MAAGDAMLIPVVPAWVKLTTTAHSMTFGEKESHLMMALAGTSWKTLLTSICSV